MAEALLRRAAELRGLDVEVISAGITFDDHGPSQGSVVAMARRGIDLSGHRSRIMGTELVASSDLVLGMARSHVREATVLAPGRFDHIYTLKELVRRGAEVGDRGDLTLDSWLAEVAAGRSPGDLLSEDPDDDIADPIGRRQTFYDETATEIEGLVRRLANLLWGPVRADIELGAV